MVTLKEIIATLEASSLTNLARALEFRADSVVVFECEDEHKNGTGYFDGLVNVDFEYELTIVTQKMYVSMDEHERVIIVIPMPAKLGNVVLFQRYKNSDILVSNNPRELEGLLSSKIPNAMAEMLVNGSFASTVSSLLSYKRK